MSYIRSYIFEVRHPRCVSNKSNCKVYAYIAKHNYVLGGMLFTIRKAQLRASAQILAIIRLYNENLSIRYTCICRGCIRCRVGSVSVRSRKCGGVWRAWLWAG